MRDRIPQITGFMRYRAKLNNASCTPVVPPWCGFKSISMLLVSAVIKLEDPGFFSHRGLALGDMARRIYRCLLHKEPISGVSTISMQLARNLYLTPTRSYSRKTKEMLLALQLELMLSKLDILELYLNVIEWGHGVWGVSSASECYFYKSPHQLDCFEACLLASLIPAPLASLHGKNAERARIAVNIAACSLFLSGIIAGDDCSRLLKRNIVFHDSLKRGVSFAEAVMESAVLCRNEPNRLAAIRLCDAPVPQDRICELQMCWGRQQKEFQRLKAIYGIATMSKVLTTGDLRYLEKSK